jgi:hypothetical protein
MVSRRSIGLGVVAAAVACLIAARTPVPPPIQFVFTSDPHYGIMRAAFRGRASVNARIVNEAMVAKIDSLLTARFPKDGGLRSAEPVGPIDFVVEGGDIANRSETKDEVTIQDAATSWAEFRADYIDGLTLRDSAGKPSPLYLVPGNHDVSSAIGFYKPMTEHVDAVPMVEIFNAMMRPAVPRTTASYLYPRDSVRYTHDIAGMHFVFITIWPDSETRQWLERDLAVVSNRTPVILITHDQPTSEAKHFRNPNGAHDVNDLDKFENLLSDELADGRTTSASTEIEQAALEAFLERHANISAYFHGNSNWNQFYDWTGPDHRIALHTFRVDSPMKGKQSAEDETRLSFQVVTIDPAARLMTVRECLWNLDPAHPDAAVGWGASTTVALFPRPD